MWGTCFLVGLRGRIFAITAAHNVGQSHSTSVLISPVDGSTHWLALTNGYRMIPASDEDLTEYDVLAYEVNFKRVPKSDATKARIIELDKQGATDWKDSAHTSTFFLFGYPQESNEVDYKKMQFISAQALLAGQYLGPSNVQAEQHEIEVGNPLNFSTFAGFSGSPVFSLQERFCSEPTMRFCGIALTGGPRSQKAHFLEASAILSLLEVTIHRLGKFGSETIAEWLG